MWRFVPRSWHYSFSLLLHCLRDKLFDLPSGHCARGGSIIKLVLWEMALMGGGKTWGRGVDNRTSWGHDVASSVCYGSVGRVARVASCKAAVNVAVRMTWWALSLEGGALPEDAMWDCVGWSIIMGSFWGRGCCLGSSFWVLVDHLWELRHWERRF